MIKFQTKIQEILTEVPLIQGKRERFKMKTEITTIYFKPHCVIGTFKKYHI